MFITNTKLLHEWTVRPQSALRLAFTAQWSEHDQGGVRGFFYSYNQQDHEDHRSDDGGEMAEDSE